MKLISLKFEYVFDKIGEAPDYPVLRKLEGKMEFQGETGSMTFPISEQDRADIESLLLVKTKVLAAEA